MKEERESERNGGREGRVRRERDYGDISCVRKTIKPFEIFCFPRNNLEN